MMGLARVIGTSRGTIVQEASRLLDDPLAYRAMTSDRNPFGDGKAAYRITEALSRWARSEQPFLEEAEEFDSAVAYGGMAA
jgi:UDP-N-acetylglucosamine 2-epimerase (non-hydrolysing)